MLLIYIYLMVNQKLDSKIEHGKREHNDVSRIPKNQKGKIKKPEEPLTRQMFQ